MKFNRKLNWVFEEPLQPFTWEYSNYPDFVVPTELPANQFSRIHSFSGHQFPGKAEYYCHESPSQKKKSAIQPNNESDIFLLHNFDEVPTVYSFKYNFSKKGLIQLLVREKTSMQFSRENIFPAFLIIRSK